MNSASLLLDDGVAETRAALIVDGVVRGFWFGPPLAEASARPIEAGDIVCGRIAALAPGLAGAFVDVGAGSAQGFLEKRHAQARLVEGASAMFRVRRAGDGRKGPELDGDWRAGLSGKEVAAVGAAAGDGPGRVELPGGLMGVAIRRLAAQRIESIVCRSVDTLATVREAADAAGVHATIEPDGDDVWPGALEATLDQSLQRVQRAGEAILTFDEAEAGTMIDVDGGGNAGGAGVAGSYADRINAAAAASLAVEFGRRAIGGVVCIDFLPPSGAEARKALARLARGLGRVEECAADGFVRIVRPRRGPSLIGFASEAVGAEEGFVRPGRRLSRAWRLRAAVRSLELALRARPSAQLTLALGADLAEAAGDADLSGPLAGRHGARFRIERREEIIRGRGYDVYER